MFDEKHPLYPSYRMAKRIVIGIVGGTVLALGIVMMITPGPGIPAILVGLGILGIEFAWARIWLKKAKQKAQDVGRSISGKPAIDRTTTSEAAAPGRGLGRDDS